MKIKNLWVGNVYRCLGLDGRVLVINEPGERIDGCILKQIEDNWFKNIITGEMYSTHDNFGVNKVDTSSLKPLSDYYTPLLKIEKKNKKIINSEVVYENVKTLKKINKKKFRR